MKAHLYRLGEAVVALSLAGAAGYGLGRLQVNNLHLAEAWFDARLRPYVWPYDLARAQRPARSVQPAPPPERCALSRDELLRPAPLRHAQEARIVPSFVDGKAQGFKVYAVSPRSIFARVGLQNGDLVRRINGFDLTHPDRALDAYATLRSAASLVIDIERRGTPVALTCSLR